MHTHSEGQKKKGERQGGRGGEQDGVSDVNIRFTDQLIGGLFVVWNLCESAWQLAFRMHP